MECASKTRLTLTWQLCFFLFCLIFFFASTKADDSSSRRFIDGEKEEKEEESELGYGYNIASVSSDLTTTSLNALLNLIKPSSVYGPDIPLLSLTAR